MFYCACKDFQDKVVNCSQTKGYHSICEPEKPSSSFYWGRQLRISPKTKQSWRRRLVIVPRRFRWYHHTYQAHS